MKRRSAQQPPARLAYALVAVLIGLGAALRVVSFPVAVYTPDEDAYANFYAVPMFDDGLSELPKLVRDYNAQPRMLQFPSPTRVGHLWAIVGFMNLMGRATIQNAAWVSAIASVLILLLVARIGLRFLSPWAAAVALLFAVASPLDLAMARRVRGDELFALCALGSVYAFLEHAAGGRGRHWMVLCLALAGYSLLVKEAGALVLALAAAGLAIVAWRTSGPLRATFARVASANQVNAYMREYQTGGPGYYARGLLLLQPVAVTLGAVGALLAAGARRRRAAQDPPQAGAALLALAWFTILFVAVALAWPQKNLRFLSPVYAPLDLLAAGLVWVALEELRARRPGRGLGIAVAVVVLGLLAAAILDYQRFVELFIRRGIPDLATPWFTRAPG